MFQLFQKDTLRALYPSYEFSSFFFIVQKMEMEKMLTSLSPLLHIKDPPHKKVSGAEFLWRSIFLPTVHVEY